MARKGTSGWRCGICNPSFNSKENCLSHGIKITCLVQRNCWCRDQKNQFVQHWSPFLIIFGLLFMTRFYIFAQFICLLTKILGAVQTGFISSVFSPNFVPKQEHFKRHILFKSMEIFEKFEILFCINDFFLF